MGKSLKWNQLIGTKGLNIGVKGGFFETAIKSYIGKAFTLG